MTLLALGLSLVLLAGVLARLLERQPAAADRAFRWGTLAGCLTGIAGTVPVLGSPGAAGSATGLGAVYGLDPLSAWFTAMFLGVGAAIASYGSHYMARERPERRVGGAHLLLAVLITGLTGVVTARTIVAFLAAWEVMAISAWLLVIFERQHAEVRRAGLVYLIRTHTSTIALFGMFAAWSGGSGGGTFAELASASGQEGTPVGLVALLGLVGFGIKAGVVPGHIWLPGAHAAAPSHISALLSGVMLKVGVYGLLRMVMLLGPLPVWWAWLVLLLGLLSAVLGVLWALAQHDLKRLLAYHSVENIGIILLGLGVGALGSAYQQPAVGLLGFTGALLHTLNHSLFKSLLFFGAGAVLRVAGTREIDRLGGLAGRMPRTAFAFLIASLAIVGLPPLNGFVSEWVIFRGMLEAGGSTGPLRLASVAAAGLVLAGALALACFTKLHGVVFLGAPRGTPVPESGTERGLVAPQWVLAAFCIAIGGLPFLVLPTAARVASWVLGSPGAGDMTGVTESVTTISLAVLALLALGFLLWRLRVAGRARDMVRAGPTWGCAYPALTGRVQYTGSSYAASLLSVFGALSGSRPVTGPAGFTIQVADPVLDRIAQPTWGWVREAAFRLRRIQTGRIVWYLTYVIAALLGLLLYLWLGAGS
jgi:hydrogenase-4 component B